MTIPPDTTDKEFCLNLEQLVPLFGSSSLTLDLPSTADNTTFTSPNVPGFVIRK
jgi:hypothetical protein